MIDRAGRTGSNACTASLAQTFVHFSMGDLDAFNIFGDRIDRFERAKRYAGLASRAHIHIDHSDERFVIELFL